ncbi:MAG: NAD-dependent succinate-semialdehyde dehydrogenase [Burkholderiales bacterium]|nr:NAD-dependent succinate-semialdehyde dehydrogenase [Anaerolineae bacterium]
MVEFQFKQLIDGQWVEASNGKTWDLLNPATEESLGLMPFGGTDDVNAAIDAAARAFPAWSHKTPYERADILNKAAQWCRQNQDELGRISTEECGKPHREAKAEWGAAIGLLEWYAEECKRAYGRTIPSRKAGRRISVIYQPIGVVGTITAWNFPVYNASRAWAAALAAGCTVVGRPSEYTPRSMMAFAQALHEAGAPAGVVNLVNGEPDEIGQAMLNDKRLRKLHFTGSTRVGKLLLDGASRTMTHLSLELGGNAPVLIFPDVNVEQAAKNAVSFKLRNAGQVCIAPQRFYVHNRIAEEFIDRSVTIMQGLRLGNGLDAATDTGPMINERQRERVEAMVSDAAKAGAEVVVGGSRPANMPRGYFFEPTVVTNIAPEMGLYRDEIFGPVMPVIQFEDTDQALAMANSTDYGLAAYVQTNDLNTAIKVSEELEFGMVAINDWLPSTPEAPFGGIKQSGFDRECGEEGLYSYLEPKTVFIGEIPT